MLSPRYNVKSMDMSKKSRQVLWITSLMQTQCGLLYSLSVGSSHVEERNSIYLRTRQRTSPQGHLLALGQAEGGVQVAESWLESILNCLFMYLLSVIRDKPDILRVDSVPCVSKGWGQRRTPVWKEAVWKMAFKLCFDGEEQQKGEICSWKE